MRIRILITISFFLGLGCNAGLPIAYMLPSLDGTWNVRLQDVPGTLRIVVEGGRVTQYDQGGGELQPIEEMPLFTQEGGTIRFSFQATQAFVGYNNGEPADFIVAGEGTVREDGSVELTISFTSIDGEAEGASSAVMSR